MFGGSEVARRAEFLQYRFDDAFEIEKVDLPGGSCPTLVTASQSSRWQASTSPPGATRAGASWECTLSPIQRGVRPSPGAAR